MKKLTDMNNHRVITKDNGKSFEKPEEIDLHMQITSPMHIKKDVMLAVYQERFSRNPGIKAALSYDGGMSYDLDGAVDIYSAASVPKGKNPFLDFSSFEFGYSSITKYEDNKGLITYWHAGENGLSVSACDIEIV